MNPKLELQLKTIPEDSGVYQYFNAEGEILYIGKAKNLKKRVHSYFREDKVLSTKIRLLVKKIDNIKYIVVNTELDALLLENNLIKKFQPRYNTLLKDDKTYPWIAITNEEFPLIILTRSKTNDGKVYFGPYPNARIRRELQDLIRKIFKYRTCKLNLTEESIHKHKFRACINSQIGQCNAPCAGNESKEEYNKSITGIKKILKGNFSELIAELRKTMDKYVDNLAFEKAHDLKQRLMTLEQYKGRTTIVDRKSVV